MERIHGRERDEKGRFMDDGNHASPDDTGGEREHGDRRESRDRRVYGAGFAARDERRVAARRGSQDRH